VSGARERIRSGLLAAVGRAYTQPRASGAGQSVLLIRPDHLGDILLFTPALHALREALPAAHLTLLVGPWSAPAVAWNADADAVETLAFPGFERKPKRSALIPYQLLFDAARGLRGRFDTAVILRYDHWWGAWLAAAAEIPRRIGYAWQETHPFLTESVPYEDGRHETLQNARLLETLAPGLGERLGRTRFDVSDADRQWAADRLARVDCGGERRPRVAIHPGAGARVKEWPVDNWAAVADALHAQVGAQMVLTGGPNEAELTAAIGARAGAPHLDLAGQTSFSQLAAVYEQCDLVLGSDSGPLHLAVAAGAATIHLYGPVPAAKFGPWGDSQRNVVLQSPFLCAPCDRLDWPANALLLHPCMAAIRPQQVIDAALRLVRSNL
jgi:ADP-heptose:LPS heptosyltransferase